MHFIIANVNATDYQYLILLSYFYPHLVGSILVVLKYRLNACSITECQLSMQHFWDYKSDTGVLAVVRWSNYSYLHHGKFTQKV